MATQLKIDFISDISCPWCVVGLRNMEAALANIGDDIEAYVRFEPFELNPDMPPEGMDRAAYFATKYGISTEEAKNRGGEIRARAEEAGFTMNTGEGFRVYNTFDAHRLLEWAMEEGKQRALKHALFEAYFTDGKNMGDHETLAGIAESVGLDRGRACEIVAGDDYAGHVRQSQSHQRGRGVQSVPTIIVNGEYVINGGQPPAIFEKAFRHIASEIAREEAVMPEVV
ncbi:DsbA family oxidoreductase [Parasphingopyxis lamellibrachiae]|uniref:Putative DsbA family dithiol-disulfide isomerase n=1 Tax=Parasphingopyxis lamellibrachiae TaxID=680125 RepID=A0A3D9FDP4_9SPHN|nr:DsbA family oxidoreductase [Parasphingopyxis lamellibrachiae]RED15788.1 putative DsbA family dithiol-disulfide isomerase [Parasphingopyxis lamellibrachiae]